VTKKKDPKDLKKPGPKVKPIDADLAHELAKEGASMLTIQQALGRSPNPSNMSNLQNKYPELKQKIKEGREEFIQSHVQDLLPKAKWAMHQILDNPDHPGFTAATIYLHKALMKLTEVQKHEVSGNVEHIHKLDPEERQKRIQELKKELEAEVVDVAIEAEVIKDETSH
jgi:hypothetical protein